MNADGFVRIIAGNMGPVQTITLRRAGFPDVVAPASVEVNRYQDVVGNIQQTADRVMMTDREFKLAGWPDEPHHGDRIIYANGRTTVIQGRPEVAWFETDRVFIMRTLGGS